MVFGPFLEKLGIQHFRNNKKLHPHKNLFSPLAFHVSSFKVGLYLSSKRLNEHQFYTLFGTQVPCESFQNNKENNKITKHF